MSRAHGFDLSRYEGIVNFSLAKSRGIRFSVTRGTVGDYYTDTALESLWKGGEEVINISSAYLVVAPADSTGTRKISADAHLKLFQTALKGKQPSLGRWVVDSELTRGQSKDYITGLTKDIVKGLWAMTGNPPIIYTRQSWWDYNVNPDPIWPMCDLWAARYSTLLSSPWGDGYYKFRDWKDWKFWQYTEKGNGPYYGTEAASVDLDWFNGTEIDLLAYCGYEPPKANLHDWSTFVTESLRRQGYPCPDLEM